MENDPPTLYSHRIKDLEVAEHPKERLEHLGSENLNNSELLAILLRSGTRGESAVEMASRLLLLFGNLHGIQKTSFHELASQHGVGKVKAAQIKAAIETPTIHSPEDAAELVRYDMEHLVQENLWVLCLDVRNRNLGIEKLYKGSLTLSQVRVGEIFRTAIIRNSTSIIVFHNHPSGDPTASAENIALTKAIQQSGKLLDIPLLDHIIIGAGIFVSLKEKKIIEG
jgi:DNA repair protein RadC